MSNYLIMARIMLTGNGYIAECDVKPINHAHMFLSSLSKYYPYSFQTDINDTVAINRIKQAYNKESYKLQRNPSNYIFDASWKKISWKTYVHNTIKKLYELNQEKSVMTVGYVSYEFRINCTFGTFIRDENSPFDWDKECHYSKCRNCKDMKPPVEWESY